MSGPERMLRETLRQRLDDEPPMRDQLPLVAHRVGKMRRRRRVTAVSLAALVVLAVAAGLGIAGINDRTAPPAHRSPSPTPSNPAPGSGPVAVDTLLGGGRADSPLEIRTTDGHLVAVPGLTGDVFGYRVPAGWLLIWQGSGSTGHVYLLRDGSAPQRLDPDGAEAITVSADGTRVAWHSRPGSGTAHSTIMAGRLTAAGLAGMTSTRVAGYVDPAVWVGDRVVLETAGNDPTQLSLWQPGHSPGAVASPNIVESVLGVAMDGRHIVVTVPQETGSAGTDGPWCLGLVDAATLQPTSRSCALLLTDRQAPGLSPDGRWLVTSGTQTDLAALFTQGRRAIHHVGCGRGTGMSSWSGPTWENVSTYLLSRSDGSVQRCRIGSARPAPVPVSYPTGMVFWGFLPSLGVTR